MVVPVIDIFTIVVSAFIMLRSFRRLHESSVHIYLAFIFAFYISPLLIDYLFAFPEYSKFYGFRVSSVEPATRIVYDICILVCVIFLFRVKSNYSVKYSFSKIKISHKWSWVGSVLAPIAAVLLVRMPSLLFAFQWRELDLYDITSISRWYSLTESLTYVGIITSCYLLFDKSNTPGRPLFRLLSSILLFMNICIEGKRAALFFAILVIIIILLYKYIDEIREIEFKKKKIGIKTIFIWAVILAATITGLYFMYQFSIDVKIGRGYSDETEVMVEAFRIDAFRDDRVRMSIYSQLNPETMRILDYPGQTIWDCFKYLAPLNLIYGKLGFSRYLYQHYFTAALDKTQLGLDCSMTVSVFSELISNFGIIIGLLSFIYLTLFFVKITDKSPQPFKILFICCFIMMNLFDLSYGMLLIEFCAVMYYFNIKAKRIHI